MPSLSIFQKSPSCQSHGDHPDTIAKALQALYPQIMTKVRFQLALKPTTAEKAAQGKTGFVPPQRAGLLKGRMLGLVRCKSLVKNEEAHP